MDTTNNPEYVFPDGIIDQNLLTVPDGTAMAANDSSATFGWCPDCGKTNGFRNIGRTHWFYCDTHGTRWCVGSNLMSGWLNENDAIWAQNARYLEDYREVDGYTPTPAMLERELAGG